ncbi:MAG TPA: VOC family protein [Anaerolineales bacterium]|nr:VOC family protein [Anaerolineales bacterium]
MTKPNFLAICLLSTLLVTFAMACSMNAPLALTATPIPGMSSTDTSNETSLISTRGGFFALSVADINASANWYSEKLGLTIIMQPPKTNQSTVVVLEGGGLIVELIQHDNALPLSEIAPTIKDRTLIHGIVKVGVIVDDFDKTVAILRERNVPIAFGPFPATTEQRANVIIQDNEGNLIQFFGNGP